MPHLQFENRAQRSVWEDLHQLNITVRRSYLDYHQMIDGPDDDDYEEMMMIIVVFMTMPQEKTVCNVQITKVQRL